MKVEGTTQYEPVTGGWFRCRLTISSLPKREQGGRARVEKSPTLMYGLRDENGDAVLLTFNDKVEVRSEEQGIDTEVFLIDGDPVPLRKRRLVIGYEVQTKRVQVHPGSLPD